MVKTALRLKPKTFYRYIRSFGFGMKTSVDLPAEESGFLKTLPKWTARTQVTLAWGQEIGVTPLQVVMAGAVVANDGFLMKPRLILKFVDNQGKVIKSFGARKVRRVVSRSTAVTLRDMMTEVVEKGTARKIRTDRYSIAGKTGTVEKINPKTGEYLPGRFHSSFVGMVPASHPKYVCLVMLNDPKLHKHGGACAAPVFREIMDRIFSLPTGPLANKIGAVAEGPQPKLPVLASKNFWKSKADSPQGPSGGSGVLSILFHTRETGMENKRPLAAGNGESPLTRRVMPELVALSLREALQRVSGLGIQIRYRGVGRVVEQYPKSSTRLKAGSICVLRLKWQG
jgi:membrane peptidoglycan carboxypeptidase